MKTFKCVADLEQVRNAPLYATIKSLFLPVIADCPEYRPEDDGYLVLIERQDVDRVGLTTVQPPFRFAHIHCARRK